MVSKKAFDAVGGFDERLSGFEDDDLFLRLFRAGYDNDYLDVALTQWRIYPVSASFTYRTARSRMIYFRKLLEQFPDDPDFERYMTRDFLIPRFFPWLVREYTRNLRKGTDEQVRTAYENLKFACSIHKLRVRMTIGPLLLLIRSPVVARALLPLMTLVRPLVRRFLR
jgi:GT2 family glycosyltransferase